MRHVDASAAEDGTGAGAGGRSEYWRSSPDGSTRARRAPAATFSGFSVFTLAEKWMIQVGARRELVYREELNFALSASTGADEFGLTVVRAIGGNDGVLLTVRARAILQHGSGQSTQRDPVQYRETTPLHAGNGACLDSTTLTIPIFCERPIHRCDGGPLQQFGEGAAPCHPCPAGCPS